MKRHSPNKKRIVGWYIYILECADGSTSCGMCSCRDLDRIIKEINAGDRAIGFRSKDYKSKKLPVKIVFKENIKVFKEVLIKYRYLRDMTKTYRKKLIETGIWPVGKRGKPGGASRTLRSYLIKST